MNSYNSWKTPKEIFTKGEAHKLSREIIATNICVQAEKIFPNMFRAVSLRQNILHIEIKKEKVLELKMIEGKLIQELNSYTKTKNLGSFGVIEKIRLTITEK